MKVSVSLQEKDWMDLVHFVTGDLHNMEDGNEIAEQMSRICDTIATRVAIKGSAPTAGGEKMGGGHE